MNKKLLTLATILSILGCSDDSYKDPEISKENCNDKTLNAIPDSDPTTKNFFQRVCESKYKAKFTRPSPYQDGALDSEWK